MFKTRSLANNWRNYEIISGQQLADMSTRYEHQVLESTFSPEALFNNVTDHPSKRLQYSANYNL